MCLRIHKAIEVMDNSSAYPSQIGGITRVFGHIKKVRASHEIQQLDTYLTRTNRKSGNL